MHNLSVMHVSNSLADIPEIGFYLRFRNLFTSNFVEQCTSICILKDHVGDFSFGIDCGVEELDNIRMRKFVMMADLVFRNLVNLYLTMVLLF